MRSQLGAVTPVGSQVDDLHVRDDQVGQRRGSRGLREGENRRRGGGPYRSGRTRDRGRRNREAFLTGVVAFIALRYFVRIVDDGRRHVILVVAAEPKRSSLTRRQPLDWLQNALNPDGEMAGLARAH